MHPLETFFQTLLPKESDFDHFKQFPKIRPFREEDFLKKLLKSGFKIKNVEIYRSFIRCINFVKWFRNKKKRALRDMIKTYVQLFESKKLEEIISDPNNATELYDIVNNQYVTFKKKKLISNIQEDTIHSFILLLEKQMPEEEIRKRSKTL